MDKRQRRFIKEQVSLDTVDGFQPSALRFNNVFEKKHLFVGHLVVFSDSLVPVDQCRVQFSQPLSEAAGR